MKNDKQKMILVAGLGLVLVAVGAFQFIPKKSTAPPAATVAEAEADADKKTENTGKEGKQADPRNEELVALGVMNPLGQRDPFTPQNAVTEPEQQPDTTAQPGNAAPVRPSGRYSGGSQNSGRMPGNVPPFDPMGGGSLPAVGETNAGIGLDTSKPLRQPGELSYEVKGVLVGDRPLAVFEDDSGNQRLVPLGGSLDRDSKVIGIEKGKVRIRHRGKEKTLRLPEGP